jgi:hypothetical protein
VEERTASATVSAKYNEKTDEQGTFSLKQQCYFKASDGADVRPEAVLRPC